MFDLKVQKSFENMENFWLDEIKKYGEKDVQLVVVGNKADCQGLEVAEEQLAEFSLKHGITCFRVSAKTGEGVAQAYEALAKNCLKTFGKTSEAEKSSVADELRKKKAEFKLKSGQEDKQKKKCC